MQPALGDKVTAHIDPTLNDGVDEAPAVITRIDGVHAAGGWVVRLTLFLATPAAVMAKTRVWLVDERPGDPEQAIGKAWWLAGPPTSNEV